MCRLARMRLPQACLVALIGILLEAPSWSSEEGSRADSGDSSALGGPIAPLVAGARSLAGPGELVLLPPLDPSERARRIALRGPAREPADRDPESEAELLRTGAESERSGDYEAARDAYARLVGRGMDDLAQWRGLGRTRLRTGDLIGGEAAFLAALERALAEGGRADVARSYRDLGEVYLALDRPSVAVVALERASALAPDATSDALLWQARLALSLAPRELAARAPLWAAPTPLEKPTRPRREPPASGLLAFLSDEVRADIEALLAGDSAVPTPLLALGVLALLLVLLGGFFRQRGDLTVAIEYPDELRGVFRVKLQTRPPSERERSRRASILRGGTSTRTEHQLVSRETHFRRVKARRYFVVLEGVLQDPATDEVLADVFEQGLARIRFRRTVRLEFDLRSADCPFDVRVFWHAEPVREASVAAKGLPEPIFYMPEGGELRLSLPKGRHTLRVGSGDRVVEVDVDLQSAQRKRVTVDMADSEHVVFKGCPPAVEPYLLGDLEAVARALERDGQPEHGHLLLARHHRSEGRLEEGAAHFEQAGRPFEAGELRAELSEFGRAAELFDAAGQPLRAAQMYRAAGELALAGEAYERAHEYEGAIECYRDAGEIERWIDALERSGETFAAAQVALEQGERPRAIRLLQRVNQDDRHWAEACSLLADAFERESHWDLAAEKLEEHIGALRPTERAPTLYARLADLHEHAGSIDQAVDALEELRRQEPTYPNIASRLEVLRKQRSARLVDERAGDPEGYAPTVFLSESRYEIQEEIGRGGMGVVFKARDQRLGRVVALKRLPDNLRAYPAAVDLFLREAQAAARLNHPNIVTLFDADKDEDGTLFLTMELLEGDSLLAILEKGGPLPAPEVAALGMQVSAGLSYSHQRGVIHRDIKTANLMRTDEGVVKIMDFGLAKLAEQVRRAASVIGGTPFYMAPEQVSGENVDHRADLYALGVTFFELSTGELPFREGDVSYHHRHTAPPDPRTLAPELPDAFADLILDLLRKQPDERPATADVVTERLTPIASG